MSSPGSSAVGFLLVSFNLPVISWCRFQFVFLMGVAALWLNSCWVGQKERVCVCVSDGDSKTHQSTLFVWCQRQQ